jgi:hypothetical protein
VYAVPSDGGTPEIVASGVGDVALPWSMSADGRTLLLVEATGPLQDFSLSVLDVANKEEKARTLLDADAQVNEPSLHPNGQWMLYHEYDAITGNREIYIRPFPNVGQARRPVGRGRHPVFSADGSEIFVFDGAGLSVAAVQDAPFGVGSLRELFRGDYLYGAIAADGTGGRAWDVDSKNDRFLMVQAVQAAPDTVATQPKIRVVLNWFVELTQRVPRS